MAASGLEIRGNMMFLQQRSVVRRLGTNGKGMAGTVQRIQKKSAGLDGAKDLEIDMHLINTHFIDVHFADVDGNDSRHWSQLAIVRLARTMHDKGPITKARKACVKAAKERSANIRQVCRDPAKPRCSAQPGLAKWRRIWPAQWRG